jgi:hypothetical protein
MYTEGESPARRASFPAASMLVLASYSSGKGVSRGLQCRGDNHENALVQAGPAMCW